MLLHQVIHIQTEAPPKPAQGMACNGCGVCCLVEPCPLGVLLSRSRKGPCKALQWTADLKQYRCGALGTSVQSGEHAVEGLSGLQRSSFARLRARTIARWIAAGSGCDCALEPVASPTMESRADKDSD
ncbi:hypothetical protein [Rhodoferax sp. GW822-FHT02A01]|uniref:hypothetical protein n=1 Tax=Rhodoferax sp. GW822-FHT02A01 TaxID=3141537 RepID=UPI00315E0257